MTEYRKHTYVTGLKKAYAELQQAVSMVPITQGCSDGDFDCAGAWNDASSVDGRTFDSPTQKFTYLLSKNLKTNKLCLNSWMSGCFSNYSGPGVYGFILNDGTIIGYESSIGIDINGQKGPNQWGRDLFAFDIAKETKNGINQGTVMPLGSKIHNQYSGSPYWKDECVTSSSGPIIDNSHSCAGRVLEEGAMNY